MESDILIFSNQVYTIVFLSTLSAWRATTGFLRELEKRLISIHALRMESDSIKLILCIISKISIHALRMESDYCRGMKNHEFYDFYPRSPHGERRQQCRQLILNDYISIHALRMESDDQSSTSIPVISLFLSTLSAWRATV